MSFKDISYLELRWPVYPAKQKHLCNFGRRHNAEQFCEIILNLDQWLRRCCLKNFLSRALVALFPAVRNQLYNFGKGHQKERIYEIISNLDQ